MYFRVIVLRRQAAFHAEQQNLGSTENSVQDLQQVHRKEERVVMDNNFSEKGGISWRKLSCKRVWDIDAGWTPV